MSYKKRTIYEIQTEFDALFELIEELDENSEDDTKIIEKFLNELETDLAEKADGYVAAMKDYDARFEVIKQEIKRLQELGRGYGKKSEKLKAILYQAMVRTGNDKMITPLHKLSICNNGGKQPVDVHVPPEALPEKYHRVEILVDKDKLREDLLAGIYVEGAVLVERGKSLRIK